jgi:hypothetical protein
MITAKMTTVMHKATFNKNNTLSNIDFLCHNVSPPLKTTLALKSMAGGLPPLEISSSSKFVLL